jgi:hypothetical protein
MAAASILLTAALVVITGYYALQTRRTVDEMRRARGANLLPSVTLSLEHPGGAHGFIVLTNPGAGPAIDVDLVMSYEPGGPQVRWSNPCLFVGQTERFLAPEQTTLMADLISKYERIVLRATYKDALGDRHQSEQTLDIKTYWELNVAATHLLHDDYEKKAAEELEKIRREIEGIKRLMPRRAV